MGRLVGFMGNRSDCLLDALHQERAAIAVPDGEEATSFGLGFYQGGEVLHKKRRLLDGESVDWEQVARGVRSDCVVIHVRHATVGDYRSENSHPFRMRSWLFAHSGTIHRFDAVKDRLAETMPDFIRRNIRGETDSEYFFHAVLSFLHDAGQLDRPEESSSAVLGALRSTVRLVDRLSKEVGAEEATLNLLLTDGRTMYGLRRGSPMSYVQRNEIHDPIEPHPTMGHRDRPLNVRYIMIESNGEAVRDDGYQAIDEGSICVVARDLEVAVHPL
ncbi:MAG: class II glutamine amidotransferase [Myxococcota bacterium]